MAMGQAARARAMEYTWQRYCDSALKTVLNPGWAMA
jgi:hypothetical protein